MTEPRTALPTLDDALAGLPPEHRTAFCARARTVVGVLVGEEVAADLADERASLDALLAALGPGAPDATWLTLAVLAGRLPTEVELLDAVRHAALDGPAAIVVRAIGSLDLTAPSPRVRVAVGEVLVDVHDTARAAFFTGIQRVAREAARHWYQDHAVQLVAWDPAMTCPMELDSARQRRLLTGEPLDEHAPPPAVRVVPWRSHYLIPELAAEHERTERLLPLARHTSTKVGAIGFDAVPLTTSETVVVGLPSAFAGHLAAARHYSRVATISQAAQTEYLGWREMLVGLGCEGPRIGTVPLAAEVGEPSAAGAADAARRLVVDDLPMVLCVGSHEPRKNHLAVLHAAEVLWREGLEFSLAFVGGNSWASEAFHARVLDLQQGGRAVQTLTGLDDDTLWAAYRLARLTVFPSVNEGFGLPAAESLASGTPVVTSGYGSMQEIGAGGGALLVDPRDDHSLVDALRRMLTDDALVERLAAEATRRPVRTWAAWAADAWSFLVDED